MCDPVSMTFAAAATMSTVGAVQQAQSASAAGKANQSYYDYVAAQNKQSADAALAAGDQKANVAQVKGAMDSAKYARSASEFNAQQRATQAAMGVGSGSVTAEDVAGDSLTKEQLDQHAIRYNADMESWSAKTGAAYQSWDYKNQSELNKIAGVNARKAGNASAAASLIGGATSIANMGYQRALYVT